MADILVYIGALLPLVLIVVFMLTAVRVRVKYPGLDELGNPPVQRITPSADLTDVGGLDAIIEDLKPIIQLLRNPPRATYPPRGILITGAPGTGKTLLAHALGSAAGVTFWQTTGSEFGHLLIGVPAKRLRTMFTTVRAQTPCILFIDQIDAIGHTRIAGSEMEHARQTVNQLCVELDNYSPAQPVLVIAATNRPDLLDPALLRSGRLERHIHLPHPDAAGRAQILRIHTQHHPLGADVDYDALAEQTEQWVGADLARLVNEAALIAVQSGHKAITARDFAQAMPHITYNISA